MRYKDLKEERDDAIARAIEAERLSMKSEFDRVTSEFEKERARLIEQAQLEKQTSYLRGFDDGVDAMANDISYRLTYRTTLKPPKLTIEVPPIKMEGVR